MQRPHRRRAIVGVAILALLSAGPYACSSKHRSASVTGRIGPAGGVVGNDDAIGQVRAGSGAVGSDVTVTVKPAGNVPDTSVLGSAAVAAGAAVDIAVSAPIADAKVRLPFDPAKQLPAKATITNAFIAVYNPTYGVWVPLSTAYDAKTHQLEATAPHFSWFRAYVVNPLAKGWDAAVDGVKMMAGQAKDWISGETSALWQIVNGEQQSLDCSRKSPDWTVTATASEISGCVMTDKPGGDATVHLRSTLRYPMIIVVPALMRHAQWALDLDAEALDWLIRALDGVNNWGYIPARGLGEAIVPASTVAGPATELKMRVEPDQLAMAINAVMTMYSFMVHRASTVKISLTSVTQRQQLTTVAEDSGTITEFVQRVDTLIVEWKTVKGQDIAALDELQETLDTVDCLTSELKIGQAVASGEIKEMAKAAATAAYKCFSLRVEGKGKELAGVVAALGDGIGVIGSLWDATRQGVLHFGAQNFVTVGRVPSGPDLDAPIYLAVDGGTNAVRKPKDATLSADSSWFLDNMAWTEWSATQAVGSGEEEINLCEPNCAEGKHRSTKAKVVLSAPRQLCGKLFYTTMKLTYGSGRSYVHEGLEPAC